MPVRPLAAIRPALPLLLAAALAGCHAEAIPVPPERCAYLGEWTGPGLQFRLFPDGRFDWASQRDGRQVAVSAPLTGFAGNDLKIGQWPFGGRYRVQLPPARKADGHWTMTIEEVAVERVGEGSGCDAAPMPPADSAPDSTPGASPDAPPADGERPRAAPPPPAPLNET